MNWFWMNVPLDVLFFSAWVGIPLWLIARHRHWGPDPASPHGNPELEMALVRVQGVQPLADEEEPGEPEEQLVTFIEHSQSESGTLAADPAL